MIDKVRQMVPHVICFAYLDDTIITCPNIKQQVSHLENIFKIITKHNLRAKKMPLWDQRSTLPRTSNFLKMKSQQTRTKNKR